MCKDMLTQDDYEKGILIRKFVDYWKSGSVDKDIILLTLDDVVRDRQWMVDALGFWMSESEMRDVHERLKVIFS